MRKRISFLLILTAVLVMCLTGAQAGETAAAGKKLPGFSVADTEEKPLTLPEAQKEHEPSPDVTEAFPLISEEAEAYVLHVCDQDGDPVPEVNVSFCTDKTCMLAKSDEDGIVTFEQAPAEYHVQLLKAPAGYHFDPEFALSVGPTYGEWVLFIQKDG